MDYNPLEGSRARSKRKISKDRCSCDSSTTISPPLIPSLGTHSPSPPPLLPQPPTSSMVCTNSIDETIFHGPCHFNKPPSPITTMSPLKPCFQQVLMSGSFTQGPQLHPQLEQSQFQNFPQQPQIQSPQPPQLQHSQHPTTTTTTEQQLRRVIELQQQEIDELKKLLQEGEEAWQNQIQERIQHRGVVRSRRKEKKKTKRENKKRK